MKTLKIWMFGLLLPAIAIAPACEKDDDDSDDGADDGDDDDGDDDDGGDDDGGDDDGGDTVPPGDDDGGDTFPDDDGGDTFPDDDGGDTFPPGDDDAGDEGPTGGMVGDQCTADSDCADNACLFAGDVDYGFCSKVCESFSDCPSFWECEPVGNASANYCVPSE